MNELTEKLSLELLNFIHLSFKEQRAVYIALSGGSTPKSFFERVAVSNPDQNRYNWWRYVHLFWVDERCVAPDHTESNYGLTHKSLLGRINLPEDNIHRIRGENDPYIETARYAEEIKQTVEMMNGVPVFDWIFLGIGDDGHTASIFPDGLSLLDAEKICETVVHPVTGQYRITLTGKPILQAKKITFIVSGESKSTIVGQIINNENEALSYPAGQVYWHNNNTDWYIDKKAAKHIQTACRGKYKTG